MSQPSLSTPTVSAQPVAQSASLTISHSFLTDSLRVLSRDCVTIILTCQRWRGEHATPPPASMRASDTQSWCCCRCLGWSQWKKYWSTYSAGSKMVILVEDRVRGTLLLFALAAAAIRPIRELQHRVRHTVCPPVFIFYPGSFYITQSRPLAVTSLKPSAACLLTPSRSPGQPGGRHWVSFIFFMVGVWK